MRCPQDAARTLRMRYCLICSVLLTFALPGMATEPASFRCSKPIDRGTATGESILAVTLDSDVYAATRRDFPDLRIFDARDHEVPCLLEKATEPRTRTVRNACQSTVVSLKERGDGLDVIVRLDADAPAADGLNIMTPLANYERRVSIEGSNDGLGWTPLLAGGVIFDYSRYMDIGNRELRLPYNSYRQFRLSISGIADTKESPFLDLTRKYRGGRETERTETTVLERRPFRIDRIELWHEQAEKTFEYDRKADYKAAGSRHGREPRGKEDDRRGHHAAGAVNGTDAGNVEPQLQPRSDDPEVDASRRPDRVERHWQRPDIGGRFRRLPPRHPRRLVSRRAPDRVSHRDP